MNVRFLNACLALWLFSAGGCASGPKVVTEYDSSVDLTALRTFAFSGVSDRGHEVGASDTSPLRQRVKDMLPRASHRQGNTASRHGRPSRPAGTSVLRREGLAPCPDHNDAGALTVLRRRPTRSMPAIGCPSRSITRRPMRIVKGRSSWIW